MKPNRWQAWAAKAATMTVPFAARMLKGVRRGGRHNKRQATTSYLLQDVFQSTLKVVAHVLSEGVAEPLVFADRDAYRREGVEASIKHWALSDKNSNSKADIFLRRYYRDIRDHVLAEAAEVVVINADDTVTITSPSKFFTIVAQACVDVPARLDRQGILDRDYGDAVTGQPRHPNWAAVRSEHLRQNPSCRACGTTELLEVHHIQAFSLNPALEIEPSNLLTLCKECHLKIGHNGDYRRENTFVLQDAAKQLAEAQPNEPCTEVDLVARGQQRSNQFRTEHAVPSSDEDVGRGNDG